MKVIWNYTSVSRTSLSSCYYFILCVYPVPFLRYSAANNGVWLKFALIVIQVYWRWHLIRHIALAFRSNGGPVLYHVRDKAIYWSKIWLFSSAITCIRRPNRWLERIQTGPSSGILNFFPYLIIHEHCHYKHRATRVFCTTAELFDCWYNLFCG